LADVIETKIASLDLEEVWTKIEQPLIPILAQMEMTGILVDPVQIDFFNSRNSTKAS